MAQAAFTLVCLPYEAFFSLDAMLRTAWRMLVTHKRLLEWNPSGDSDRSSRTTASSARTGPCGSARRCRWLAIAARGHSNPAALAVAGPILCLWLASPGDRLVDQPAARPPRGTADGAIRRVSCATLSRKTWAFFETFVGPEDHWLPPDNYQEHPAAVIAHRTSPTNMGLALLANLAAYDFGYHVGRTAHRAHGQGTRHHGRPGTLPRPLLQLVRHAIAEAAAAALHFDGGQRQPRRPSADLARRDCSGLPTQKILGPRLFDGLGDTLGIFMDDSGRRSGRIRPGSAGRQLQQDLESAARSYPTRSGSRLCLDQLARSADVELPPTWKPSTPIRESP